MILGPADASHFRVKVGRYGDRWYCDPLPADDIATAAEDDAWPSISTVKKASGSDWSYVAMKRAANASNHELLRLAALSVEERYDTFKGINRRGLDVAAGRGTILHWWGEDLSHGLEPRDVTPLDLTAAHIPAISLEHALRYLPALRQFFDTYQPELIAAEYPVIHRTLNGVGYGGTPDGLWKIDGDVYAFDYKTRSEDGDHAAYPEEGAQIAAGACAEYMIVEGAAGAERQPIPEIKAGMVVSVKPDGCRIYPIDLDHAFTHFTSLHAWWVARRDEREAIGRPWPVRKRKEETWDSTQATTAGTAAITDSAPSDLLSPTLQPSDSGTSPTTTTTPTAPSTAGGTTTTHTSTPSTCSSSTPTARATSSPRTPDLSPTPSTPSSPTSTTIGATDSPSSSQDSETPKTGGRSSTSTSRDVVYARIKRLVDDGHGLKVQNGWPDGIPGFKTDHVHSVDELAQLDAMAHGIEIDMGYPFTNDDMTLETPPRHPVVQAPVVSAAAAPEPAHTTIDEGGEASHDALQHIKTLLAALDPTHIELLERIAKEAYDAGTPISLVQAPTVRRWEIVRALILWADYWDEDVVRDLLGESIGQWDITPRPLGAVVGSLNVEQAKTFAEMAVRLSEGAELLHNSRWRIVTAAN